MNSHLRAAAPLRCISLHRPWAQWVLLGWKTIETRTHARFAGLVGERIGIHAALTWDGTALERSEAWRPVKRPAGWYDGPDRDRPDFWQGGKLLGTVRVQSFRVLTAADAPAALIECETPRFGLFLEEPELFPTPLPLKGAQGIFFYRGI